MADRRLASKTMRIDLIPDAPPEPPAGGQQKRVVVKSAKRRPQKSTVFQNSAYGSDYHELLYSVYDAALIADLNGQLVDANPRAVEFLRYTHADLCALKIFDVISGADESLLDALSENLQTERYALIQAYCVRRNGSVFPAEIAVNKLRLREPHLCFFVRDITIRRQSEEMLRTEHNAIQNAGGGIAVADVDAHIEYANPAAAEMWGYESPEDLLEKSIRDLLVDKAKADALVAEVLKNRTAWRGEALGIRNNGDHFTVEIAAVRNRDTEGEITGIVFSFSDVSDRKRAEAMAKESERQRVMLESLGAACHHLGQPTTVLLANLGLLQQKLGDGDETITELLDSSVKSVRSLGEVLHRLNQVEEYRTTAYLPKGSDGETPEHRILDI